MSCFERAVTQYPDKIAMIDGVDKFTYREFGERVCMLANGLKSLGLKPGDALSALCLNHHRYLEIYFACHMSGVIINPLNIRLGAEELVYILNDSESKVLFIDKPFLPMLPKIKEGCKDLEHVYFSDSGDAPEGMSAMAKLMNGQPNHCEPVEVDEDDVASYCYTGGTTGMPKGVMLTSRNIIANAFHLQSMMQYTDEDSYLHIAPMFHLADAASLYAITMMGGTHVFGRAFDPELTLKLIQDHKVTAVLMVPTMINFVINHPKFGDYDLSSLRTYIYGASPMPVPLLKKAMEKFPCGPNQGYGMTEAAPLVTVLTAAEHQRGLDDPDWEWLLSSAGRAIPGVDMKVVNEEGEEVAIGEAGEIIVRAANVMKGYLKKKKETAEAIRDGWYWTGDVAVRNRDGYISIVDRAKDMIISGGENIYTTEVENVVMRHEAVMETTVIGVPDEKWGEVVKAFIVVKPGEEVSEEGIIEFCREHLAHFKCPRSVDFLDELPKSGAGKILKRELRTKYWGEGKQVN